MRQPHAVSILASLFLAMTSIVGAEGVNLSLDGAWEQVLDDGGRAEPASGWQPVQLPALRWVPSARRPAANSLWSRRTLTLPAYEEGSRVLIDLRGARFLPELYVDGKPVAGGSDGWSPSLFDITDQVRPRGTHRLAVRVWEQGRSRNEEGKSLMPLGGFKDFIGVWDSTWLRILPKQHLLAEELVVSTSVRTSKITLTGRASDPGMMVVAEVRDGERTVLRLPPAATGANGEWTTSAAFADARRWSPEDPFRYTLNLSLRQRADGQNLHTLESRFGFREIWTSGADIVLNGVPRRLLASSSWPASTWVEPAEIRRRVELIRQGGANAFRLHIGPWQEAWFDAADELGLLIVGESALYTDLDGSYAYRDPRFWDGYRRHVEGMLRRDRNRPSLIMWSLGNEILFMGMSRFDAELPRKLGDMGRFARSLDPSRPLTFEADGDPDGAYDVIGLHYPHEMPEHVAYPGTCDWIAAGGASAASGGMLGQQSTGFRWDRSKPLYIGEYLWLPHMDYACGTIWHGDDAFTDLAGHHASAQALAWFDQTLAYRRHGVSAMAPWTASGFGGVQDQTAIGWRTQREFFRPVAAYARHRGTLRGFAGERVEVTCDAFNDGASPLDGELRLVADGRIVDRALLQLKPGARSAPTLGFTPGGRAPERIETVLVAGSDEVHRASYLLRIEPRLPLRPPRERKLVIVDPSQTMPQAVPAIPAGLDPKKSVLLIAPGALGDAVAGEVRIGAPPGLGSALRTYLLAGGRAVVLEQGSLASLGLGLEVREQPSTMAFALDAGHPLLAGMSPGDLSWWRDGDVVTRFPLVRPHGGGARAAAVVGGKEWTALAPLVDLPVGSGKLVLIQMLAGAKLDREPAARRLVQNAIDWAGEVTPPTRPVRVIPAQTPFAEKLAGLGLETAAGASDFLVLQGGGADVLAAGPAITATLRAGGTVYWHGPSPDAFRALADALGGKGLSWRPTAAGVNMHKQGHELLLGTSREDVVRTTVPSGWNRSMTLQFGATSGIIEAPGEVALRISASSFALKNAAMVDGKAVLDRRGSMSFAYAGVQPGLHRLKFDMSVTGNQGPDPIVALYVDGQACGWIDPSDTSAVLQASLEKSSGTVELRYANAPEWGGGRRLAVGEATLEKLRIDQVGFAALTMPMASATWKAGLGKVVIDGIRWDEPWSSQADPRRYANGLFAALGARFSAPTVTDERTAVPLKRFELVGESPYFSRSETSLECRSNAVLAANLDCVRAGTWRLAMTARGSTFRGSGPVVAVEVNGKQVASLAVNGSPEDRYVTPPFRLGVGKCSVRLIYANDEHGGGEDRNLSLLGVEFSAAP